MLLGLLCAGYPNAMRCKRGNNAFCELCPSVCRAGMPGGSIRHGSKFLHPINCSFCPHFPFASRLGPSLLTFPMSSPSCCFVVWMPVSAWIPRSCTSPVSSRFGRTAVVCASPPLSSASQCFWGGHGGPLLFGAKNVVSECLLKHCLAFRGEYSNSVTFLPSFSFLSPLSVLPTSHSGSSVSSLAISLSLCPY